MRECKNYFHMLDNFRNIIIERNEFTIENGKISPIVGSFLVGQYIRIVGSIQNDGIYQIERVGDGYIDVSIHDADYPTWMPPSGTVGLYDIGDRVTHNGIRFVSLVDNNSWEPGTDDRLWEKVGIVEHSLKDEVFTGVIAGLIIPREFLQLVREIEAFEEKARKDPNRGVLTSESFSNYSYNMATTASGMAASWREVFASRLHRYRRPFPPRIL